MSGQLRTENVAVTRAVALVTVLTLATVGVLARPVASQGQLRIPPPEQLYRYGLREAFPFAFEQPNALVERAGRIYVAERGGRIYSFDRHATAPPQLVLDLRERVIAAADSGLCALEVRGRELYVFYPHWIGRPVTLSFERAEADFTHELRLSRFLLSDAGVAEQDTEEVLIAVRDRHLFHQGGGMFFHPRDGFLYLGVGDEGRIGCGFDTCQRVDRSFFGGVLRIDVDQRGGAISHPIRRQPAHGRTAHYYIPNDNPFVGKPRVLEEFYALGLRNPYRMAHDPVDDVVFIADVGDSAHEEIDVLAAGANFQWDIREGEELLNEERPRAKLGLWTDPAWSYERDAIRTIIGGYVYRGTALPGLQGAYVHADYRTGSLWAARYEVRAGQVRIRSSDRIAETGALAEDNGIISLALGEDRELFVLLQGKASRIQRLVAMPEPAYMPPALLSQTGLFRDTATLEPAPGLIEYQVNVPLWSDGTDKRRFVALPNGQSATLAPETQPELPPGTVFVKHFELAPDAFDPSTRLRLETRVSVVQEHGVHAVTYRWRADQRDAELVLAHAEIGLEYRTADGHTGAWQYVFPSPAECLRCHAAAAGDALGFRTAQLNRPLADGSNQLAHLARAGVLALGAHDVSSWPRLYGLQEHDVSLEHRVRSYLDANCSFCHGWQVLYGTRWDARVGVPAHAAGIVDGATHHVDQRLRIVRPRDPEHSLLLRRVATTETEQRMPPIGSQRVDVDFAAVLERWIVSLRQH
ncbi:MAG: PQQ-dependent sugar dehydrogenase [Polyangiales bacterium]